MWEDHSMQYGPTAERGVFANLYRKGRHRKFLRDAGDAGFSASCSVRTAVHVNTHRPCCCCDDPSATSCSRCAVLCPPTCNRLLGIAHLLHSDGATFAFNA